MDDFSHETQAHTHTQASQFSIKQNWEENPYGETQSDQNREMFRSLAESSPNITGEEVRGSRSLSAESIKTFPSLSQQGNNHLTLGITGTQGCRLD